MTDSTTAPNVLIVACGALARELRLLPATFEAVVTYLPANLHNRPDRIVAELDSIVSSKNAERIASTGSPFERIVVGYADCGTAGAIDTWCNGHDAHRLPGAHCYETFVGTSDFERLTTDEPGTFFLTDYLALHFDALVMDGLGITDHPELCEMYFGNYRRVTLISQSDDAAVDRCARAAAARLGLEFTRHHVGRERLNEALVALPTAKRSAIRSEMPIAKRSAKHSVMP